LRSKSHTLVPANFGSFALGSASAAKLLRSKSQAGQTLLRKIAKLSMRLTTFRQTGLGALNPFGVTGPGAAHALLALALALAQLLLSFAEQEQEQEQEQAEHAQAP